MSLQNNSRSDKLIDRDAERKQFLSLLNFEANARILAIQDEQGGMGKSLLLKTLRDHCLEQEIPACLIEFHDDFQHKSPYLFMKHVVGELLDVPFKRFKQIQDALDIGDIDSIRRFVDPVAGVVNLSNAKIEQGADLRASIVSFENAENPTIIVRNERPSELKPEEEKIAKAKSIDEFYADIKDYCRDKPIVIFIDAYEKCRERAQSDESWQELDDWLLKFFLRPLFVDLDGRPHKLAIVIAGRHVPQHTDLRLSSNRFSEVAVVVSQMSDWTKEHVVEYLNTTGMDYETFHVDFFFDMVQKGYSLLAVVEAVKFMTSSPKRKRKNIDV